MTTANSGTVTFTMKFDPRDLQTLATQISALIVGGKAGGGAAGSSTGAGGVTQPQGSASSWQIFKPLLWLEFIKKSLDMVVKNSSVANAYLGAMGKVFGAAMDMLLLPFLPILNLMLIGVTKLLEWLTRDDVQKVLKKIADYVVKSIEAFLGFIGKTYDQVNKWLDKLGVFDAIKGVLDTVSSTLSRIADKLGIKIGDNTRDTLVGAGIAAVVARLLPFGIGKAVGSAEGAAVKGGGKIIAGAAGLGGGTVAAAITGIAAAYFGTKAWARSEGSNYDPLKPSTWQGPAKSVAQSIGLTDRDRVSIKPPNVGSGGLQDTSSINASVVINVYDATDGKKVATIVQDELTKLARKVKLG